MTRLELFNELSRIGNTIGKSQPSASREGIRLAAACIAILALARKVMPGPIDETEDCEVLTRSWEVHGNHGANA